MHLDPELLARTIHALRIAVLILWSYIAMTGITPLGRIIGRKQIVGDRMSASLLLLGLSLVVIQVRSLARGAYASADIWLASGLLGLVLSGLCVYLVRCRSVEDEHKRAAILSGLGLLGVSLVAGALS